MYLLYVELHAKKLFVPKLEICNNLITNKILRLEKEPETDKYFITDKNNPKIIVLFYTKDDNETNLENYQQLKKWYDFELYSSQDPYFDFNLLNSHFLKFKENIKDDDYFIITNNQNYIIDSIITYYNNARSIHSPNLDLIGAKKKYYHRIFQNFNNYYTIKFQMRRKIFKLDKTFVFE